MTWRRCPNVYHYGCWEYILVSPPFPTSPSRNLKRRVHTETSSSTWKRVDRWNCSLELLNPENAHRTTKGKPRVGNVVQTESRTPVDTDSVRTSARAKCFTRVGLDSMFRWTRELSWNLMAYIAQGGALLPGVFNFLRFPFDSSWRLVGRGVNTINKISGNIRP